MKVTLKNKHHENNPIEIYSDNGELTIVITVPPEAGEGWTKSNSLPDGTTTFTFGFTGHLSITTSHLRGGEQW